jgi:hypothetical protein
MILYLLVHSSRLFSTLTDCLPPGTNALNKKRVRALLSALMANDAASGTGPAATSGIASTATTAVVNEKNSDLPLQQPQPCNVISAPIMSPSLRFMPPEITIDASPSVPANAQTTLTLTRCTTTAVTDVEFQTVYAGANCRCYTDAGTAACPLHATECFNEDDADLNMEFPSDLPAAARSVSPSTMVEFASSPASVDIASTQQPALPSSLSPSSSSSAPVVHSSQFGARDSSALAIRSAFATLAFALQRARALLAFGRPPGPVRGAALLERIIAASSTLLTRARMETALSTSSTAAVPSKRVSVAVHHSRVEKAALSLSLPLPESEQHANDQTRPPPFLADDPSAQESISCVSQPADQDAELSSTDATAEQLTKSDMTRYLLEIAALRADACGELSFCHQLGFGLAQSQRSDERAYRLALDGYSSTSGSVSDCAGPGSGDDTALESNRGSSSTAQDVDETVDNDHAAAVAGRTSWVAAAALARCLREGCGVDADERRCVALSAEAARVCYGNFESYS